MGRWPCEKLFPPLLAINEYYSTSWRSKPKLQRVVGLIFYSCRARGKQLCKVKWIPPGPKNYEFVDCVDLAVKKVKPGYLETLNIPLPRRKLQRLGLCDRYAFSFTCQDCTPIGFMVDYCRRVVYGIYREPIKYKRLYSFTPVADAIMLDVRQEDNIDVMDCSCGETVRGNIFEHYYDHYLSHLRDLSLESLLFVHYFIQEHVKLKIAKLLTPA